MKKTTITRIVTDCDACGCRTLHIWTRGKDCRLVCLVCHPEAAA
jgi:hypothetical protein